MRIRLDHRGNSQVFVATRTVRNSDHANAPIEVDGRVFFCQRANGITLAYADSGLPTNGTEYATFPTIAAANAFVAATGLRANG